VFRVWETSLGIRYEGHFKLPRNVVQIWFMKIWLDQSDSIRIGQKSDLHCQSEHSHNFLCRMFLCTYFMVTFIVPCLDMGYPLNHLNPTIDQGPPGVCAWPFLFPPYTASLCQKQLNYKLTTCPIATHCELVYRLCLPNICLLSQNVANYDMPRLGTLGFMWLRIAFGSFPFKGQFWERLFYAGEWAT